MPRHRSVAAEGVKLIAHRGFCACNRQKRITREREREIERKKMNNLLIRTEQAQFLLYDAEKKKGVTDTYEVKLEWSLLLVLRQSASMLHQLVGFSM